VRADIHSGGGRFAGATGIMMDSFISAPNATTFLIKAWGMLWLA
jgi:hypothetical protein